MRWGILYIMLIGLLLAVLPPAAYAEEADTPSAETNALVQKGLTIFEIDREVARLNDKDAAIAAQIGQAELDITAQDAKVQATRKHAGGVLRAYYMGSRSSLWMMMLSANSLADALRLFEYLQMIVTNDRKALNAYTESYKQLTTLKSGLEDSRVALQMTKVAYLKQRERLVSLQAELDRELAENKEAQAIMQRIQALNDQWQHQGLPLFQQYFNGLSVAFMDLPKLLADGSRLDMSSFKNPVFTLTDSDFNAFLQQTNRELFQTLQFRFAPNELVASGGKDGHTLELHGSFALIKGPSMNEVRFQVNRMLFDGYELPDTTVQDLMSRFPLAFQPKAFIPAIDVDTVTMDNGKLVVKLVLL
ncbi:hypothetical protein B5M42_022240 [Paenibacillus athensensis]|uniref:SbsC C-terminal domain-containing protein n=1 Tax=Paenibacillus athensensis TaxID=1967502 RepID=A0A4Y8PQY4_9BACL|nr:hypothetical protein [Paenibacillus athensensis]MCD1261526.1 hypothetical protein [Paenibacillus athensensis]